MTANKPSQLPLLALLAANGLAIWQFTKSDRSVVEILWIYWLQSIIIGAVNIVRILSFPMRPVINLRQMSPSMPQGAAAQKIIRILFSIFFFFHYGLFHICYGVFLLSFSLKDTPIHLATNGQELAVVKSGELFGGSIDVRWILLTGALFALHHILTAGIEYKLVRLNKKQAPSLTELMGRPYLRIIPMHLIIIIGPFVSLLAGNTALFIVFMALKTIADVALFYRGSGHPGTLNPAVQPVRTSRR
jgi:hypothetical protein